MASRVALPGSGGTGDVAGDVWSAAAIDKLPGGIIGYGYASGQSGITSAVDITGATTTCTVGTSRLLRIAWCLDCGNTVAQGATETFRVYILRDSSVIEQYDYVANPGAGTNQFTCSGFFLDNNPGAGAHTYKLQGGRSATATGSFTILAGSSEPVIVVSDEGPNF